MVAAHSNSFEQFREALGMAEELLQLERRYHNPPRLNEQKAVRGLRGAAAVLVVAAFESFLREAVEEQLSNLSSLHLKISLQKLPDKMRVSHVYSSLDRAMKGPLFQEPPPKIQRLLDIDRACKIIISGAIDPKVFCDTGGNPNPKNLRAMFSNIALDDVITSIKPQFDRKWGKPTSHTFLEDKLQEIINRRHVVAHTADTLKISRTDLEESVKFLKILVSLLDLELANHIKYLIKLCT